MNQNRLSGRPDLQRRVTDIIAQLQPRVREVDNTRPVQWEDDRSNLGSDDKNGLRASAGKLSSDSVPRGDQLGSQSVSSRGIPRPTQEVEDD